MEQRLFTIACIMYAFTWLTRWLKKRNKLETAKAFALWHGSFLAVILSCCLYVGLFIINNSGAEETGGSGKLFVGLLVILGLSIYGYFSARKADAAKKDKLSKTDLEWANTVYFAGFVASIIMFFFIQAFKIPSASMRYTLVEGDHLFVNKAAYGLRIPFTQWRFFKFSEIKPEDIIVFVFPAAQKTQVNCGGLQYGRDFVKRVIAMPGDKVEIKNTKVYVNDQLLPMQAYEVYDKVERTEPEQALDPDVYQALWEGRVLEHELGLSLRDNFGPVIVPEGSYFGLGDNRDNSCDSRFWGPIPRENIKGKAWFVHWPLNRIRLLK